MLQFSRDKLSLINLPLSCYAILPVDFHLPIKQVISYVVLHGSTIFLLLTMPYLGALHQNPVRGCVVRSLSAVPARRVSSGWGWHFHSSCSGKSNGFCHPCQRSCGRGAGDTALRLRHVHSGWFGRKRCHNSAKRIFKRHKRSPFWFG